MNHSRCIPCPMVAVILWICAVSFGGSESAPNAEAQGHFEKANELRKLKNYDGAIAEYQKVVDLAPDETIARNAQYWIGQSYFESKRFDAALSTFQELLKKYPSSSIAPATREMIEGVEQALKNRALFEAVQKTDVAQVKLLIAAGADLNANWVDVYDQGVAIATLTTYWHTTGSLLWYAVHIGDIEVVKLLVEAGADVDPATWPPLCAAVDKDNIAIAEYLIDHGANVNKPEDWGPLQEAATMSNNIEMVKLLIDRGADVNATDWPALHTAISRGECRDTAELLIRRGADVNAKDTHGYTPLYYAIRHIDDPEFMSLLIANGAKLDTKYPGGETALQAAAITGRTDVVKVLLEAGADINARNDRGQTALHAILDIKRFTYAQESRPKDMIEALLAKGAEVNLKDNDGRTPLHVAAELAEGDIVELLLDKGADINAKDDESGATALHHAARFGNRSAAEVLVARGADINAQDKQGHTPLQIAVHHDYKAAEFLLDKGADRGIRTESGRTLLELAQDRRQIESTVPDLVFDGYPNSWFGTTAVCGDVDGDGYDDVLVAAGLYDNRRGRVYLFYGGPDMDTTADLIFEGENEGDEFGLFARCGDIDNDGCDDVVIGARSYSQRRGRTYLFWGSDRNSMDANPDKVFVGEQERDAQFGAGDFAVYDIDNDGYDDIILGAYQSGHRTGRAYLYYGNTKELMDASHDLIFNGEKPGDEFGPIIRCGDVDNDGYGDIVIGAASTQNRAHLYYGGSKSSMDAKADAVFETSEGPYLGQGIVCVDQNRDGYDDVVIGAPGCNDRQGRAYLFHGNSRRSLATDPDMILDGELEWSSYGERAVCGDIDGDHVNDLIIGARGFRGRTGRAYLYWGRDLAGPDPKPGRIFTGENRKDEFGLGLACGDVNNDGFDDLVIGAYQYKAGAKQGRVYLYYGGPRNK